MKPLQAIRGMRDILTDETPRWQHLEQVVQNTLEQYGFQEIRLPIVEKTELFTRGIGDNTDIVSKEMYTFADRNEDLLTLRPEGTAGTVRAGMEHGLFYNQTQRLWYKGPMFRHERPQKGRQRQFHQIGVETFGFTGPDIDAELIILSARIWQRLGIKNVRLEINTLGTSESRKTYREQLVAYFSQYEEQLDEDSKVRLHANPLRILDSKNPDMQELIAGAPIMHDALDEESADHFKELCERLDDNDIEYEVNPRLVRGLDYYSKTVFEWITEELGAQGTICAGGRYDGLVEEVGGKPTPAVGFAMGLERLVELIDLSLVPDSTPDVYLIAVGDSTGKAMMKLAESIRDQLPNVKLLNHSGGGSFKSQFKKADKSGAKLALVLGEQEVAEMTIGVKFLREDREQAKLPWSEITNFLAEYLS